MFTRAFHSLLFVSLGVCCMCGIGGCGEVRKMLIEQKSDAIWEKFNELNDCDRVTVVERYLSGGREYNSFLDETFPTTSSMLSMLMDISERTNISRGIMISCWSGFSYGPDEFWLPLVEPWRGALGCESQQRDRRSILRSCDRVLAALIDTVLQSRAVATLAAANPRVHVEEFDVWGWQQMVEEVRAMMQRAGVDTSVDTWQSSPGDARILCDGVLPRESDPEVYVYFGSIASNRYLVKVMRRADVDLGRITIGGVGGIADAASFTRAGVVIVYEIEGAKGPKVQGSTGSAMMDQFDVREIFSARHRDH